MDGDDVHKNDDDDDGDLQLNISEVHKKKRKA